MNKRTDALLRTYTFLLLLGLLLGAGTSPCQAAATTTQDTYKNLEVFANVLSILQKNYVEEIDTEEVIMGAIKGMLLTLDPHSSYLKPENYKELQVETSGSFTGIGIEVTVKDGFLVVVSPIEGTPAFEKGIQAGDKIIKIEKDFTKEMSLMEAIDRLRGPKGTEVKISIVREGASELKEITLTRDIIPLLSVRSKLLEPGYGYVRITNFQAKTTKDLRKELTELGKIEPLKGLILDLRNNPGGLLDQAVQVCDLFLNSGVIVTTKGRDKSQDLEFKARPSSSKYTFPMVILVNEGSASAAEIVAGALQDHKRALILGTQTFGKASVQTIIPMSNGAGLRLTTARYYTPNGVSIQAKGIVPDLPVAASTRQAETAATAKEPEILREQDLKRHITGEEELEKGGGRKPGASQIEGKKEEQGKKLATELAKDLQLQSAYILLKGEEILGRLKGR